MARISDESLIEKYSEAQFYFMIDDFNERVADYKYEDGSGYWSEEDDLPVLEEVGFTKEEARYLVYNEQPQEKEEPATSDYQKGFSDGFMAAMREVRKYDNKDAFVESIFVEKKGD